MLGWTTEGFTSWFAEELATLPERRVGGRARAVPDRGALIAPTATGSFAIYYEGPFDPDALRGMRWEGEVSDVGGWGGGVMNGGAWLTVDGRRADVHYRDLDDVQFWCGEAEAGRFQKELLQFLRGRHSHVHGHGRAGAERRADR